MRRFWSLMLLTLCAPLAAQDRPVPGDTRLELRAEARACYLGFIELYDVDYLVGPSATRCIRLSYLKAFSGDALDKATRKVFAQRHGSEMTARYRAELARLGAAYTDVAPGDRYSFCVDETAGGLLLRDGVPVHRTEELDFAARLLQIWVKGGRPEGTPEWAFGQC